MFSTLRIWLCESVSHAPCENGHSHHCSVTILPLHNGNPCVHPAHTSYKVVLKRWIYHAPFQKVTPPLGHRTALSSKLARVWLLDPFLPPPPVSVDLVRQTHHLLSICNCSALVAPEYSCPLLSQRLPHWPAHPAHLVTWCPLTGESSGCPSTLLCFMAVKGSIWCIISVCSILLHIK